MTHPTIARGLRPLLLLFIAVSSAGCGLVGGSMARGQRAMDAGDYEAAVLQYGRAIQAGDSLPLAHANRCIALDTLQRHEEAVADCTASLEAAEGVAVEAEGYERKVVLNNRAVALLSLRRYEEAIADLNQAIELDPDYAEAFANRGQAAIGEQRYEEAIADLDHAIELNGSLSQAFGNRGFAWQQLGKDVEAIADYTRAIEIDNNPEAYFNRASIRYALGRFEEAYADYKAVLEYGPGTYRAFVAETQVNVLGLLPSVQDAEAGGDTAVDDEETGSSDDNGAGSDDDGGTDGSEEPTPDSEDNGG